MVLLLSFLVSALFSLFFYVIDLRYLSIFPVIFFLFFLGHGARKVFVKIDVDKMWYTYSLMLIWLLIMFGLAGLLFFVGIGEIPTYLSLLLLNLFLRIGSYVFDYKDGKEIFQFGSCLVLLIILGTILFSFGVSDFLYSLFLWTWFSLGFIAFLVFIVGILYPVEKKFAYYLFFLGMIATGMFLLYFFSDFSWAAVLCLLFFCGICVILLYVRKRKPRKPTSSIVSVRRILAGERIFKRETLVLWKQQVFFYFNDIPKRFAPLLEAINLCLLGILVFNYFSSILSTSFVSLDLFYWIGLVIFLLNVFLLKSLSYVSNVSRFSLALVINFGFYSALLQFGSESIPSVLPLLVVWIFLCQIALFYVDRLNLQDYFTKKDYLYWIIVTSLASVVNVILLFQLNLPGQFLFSLIFFYCGVELMLLYYLFQFLQKDGEEDSSSGDDTLLDVSNEEE